MSRAGLIVVVGTPLVAMVASFVASSSPDGPERVVAGLGCEAAATTHDQAPMPDQALPNVRGPLSGSVAGVVATRCS